MRRTIIFILLVFGLVAPAFAQSRGRGGVQPTQPEAVTVSGNLIIAHGSPALKSGEVTYLVGGISRLAGFIDGLKEGTHVTVIGYAKSSPRNELLKVLRPTQLTFDGRSYDMATPRGSFLPEMPEGHRRKFHSPQRQRSS